MAGWIRGVCLALAGAGGWYGIVAPATAQSAGGAVFTREQVDAGRALYAANCAPCHGRDLGGGGEAPPIAGSGFARAWQSQTTADLLTYVQQMPPGGPPLAREEYLPIVAYILFENGAPPGAEPLSDATRIPIGSIATGDRPR